MIQASTEDCASRCKGCPRGLTCSSIDRYYRANGDGSQIGDAIDISPKIQKIPNVGLDFVGQTFLSDENVERVYKFFQKKAHLHVIFCLVLLTTVFSIASLRDPNDIQLEIIENWVAVVGYVSGGSLGLILYKEIVYKVLQVFRFWYLFFFLNLFMVVDFIIFFHRPDLTIHLSIAVICRKLMALMWVTIYLLFDALPRDIQYRHAIYMFLSILYFCVYLKWYVFHEDGVIRFATFGTSTWYLTDMRQSFFWQIALFSAKFSWSTTMYETKFVLLRSHWIPGTIEGETHEMFREDGQRRSGAYSFSRDDLKKPDGPGAIRFRLAAIPDLKTEIVAELFFPLETSVRLYELAHKYFSYYVMFFICVYMLGFILSDMDDYKNIGDIFVIIAYIAATLTSLLYHQGVVRRLFGKFLLYVFIFTWIRYRIVHIIIEAKHEDSNTHITGGIRGFTNFTCFVMFFCLDALPRDILQQPRRQLFYLFVFVLAAKKLYIYSFTDEQNVEFPFYGRTILLGDIRACDYFTLTFLLFELLVRSWWRPEEYALLYSCWSPEDSFDQDTFHDFATDTWRDRNTPAPMQTSNTNVNGGNSSPSSPLPSPRRAPCSTSNLSVGGGTYETPAPLIELADKPDVTPSMLDKSSSTGLSSITPATGSSV